MGQLDQKIDILVLCAEERFEHPALIDQLERYECSTKRPRTNIDIRLNVDIYDFKDSCGNVCFSIGINCIHRHDRMSAGLKAYRLLERYNPRAVVLSGTAGSMAPDQAFHGTVVISRQVDQITLDRATSYEHGGERELVTADRQSMTSTATNSWFLNTILDASNNVSSEDKKLFDPLAYGLLSAEELSVHFNKWRKDSPYSQEYFSKVEAYVLKNEIPVNKGTFVSSNLLIADHKLRDAWRRINHDRLCVDQEAGLISVAVRDYNEHLAASGKADQQCEFIAIKGIADLSDGYSSSFWMYIASANAAAITMGSIFRSIGFIVPMNTNVDQSRVVYLDTHRKQRGSPNLG